MQTESDSFELIIILALVAVFILFQLRRTLGKKTGFDPSRDQKENPYHPDPVTEEKKQPDNVVRIKPDGAAPEAVVNLGLDKSSPFYGVVEKIYRLDHSFNLRSFFDGAEYAYGLVLKAFWDRDRKILRSMLSRQVFDQFDSVVSDLEQRKLQSDNKLMDVEKIDLINVSLSGSLAEITVEFTSHMIMATRDEAGNLIEGNDEKPTTILDIWTFCRDVKRADPNWTLVATRTG